MSILNPDHLFDQAERLIALPGRSRQADIRRAISAAYYGLFHFVVTAAADDFVGVRYRATIRYALVYRSIDHSALRSICLEATKKTPSQRFRPVLPIGGLGPALQTFATIAADMQQRRHRADYDPLSQFSASDARLAISLARGAVGRFGTAAAAERKLFLTLLVCPPRS